MPKKGRNGRSAAVWLIAVFCVAMLSVAGHGYVFAWDCTGSTENCNKYKAAVLDASGDLTSDKLYDKLTPIVAENPKLVWKDGVIGSKLLVAQYKLGAADQEPYWDCQAGVPFPKDCIVSTSPWVTVVPELLNFFKTHTYSRVRLEQLLGLPPSSGNNYVVEYWVDPKDLFRPASDPQIIYQEGSVQFPWDSSRFLAMSTSDDYKIYDSYCAISTDVSCSCTAENPYMDYKCWFNNRRAYVYSDAYASAPYPWTGLGYTCDWAHSQCRVGLSEFVLNNAPIYSGSFTVTIQSVTPAAEYMARHQKTVLTLDKPGLGKGTVSSVPKKIHCGPHCSGASKRFAKYAEVTLTAKAKSNSTFTGWSGACSGSSPSCVVPMVTDQSVNAHFSLKP